MKHLILTVFSVLLISALSGQVIWTVPAFPTQEDQVTLYYNATQGNGDLTGVVPVYIHTGVITSASTGPNDWQNVVGNWGTNDAQVLMTPQGNNIHTFNFGGLTLEAFYGVNAGEVIEELACVFRNVTGGIVGRSEGGGDIYFPLSDGGFSANFSTPTAVSTALELGASLNFIAQSSSSADLVIEVNGSEVASASDVTQLNYTFDGFGTGSYSVVLIANDGQNEVIVERSVLVLPTSANIANLPVGTQDGINYMSETSVVMRLFAPGKDFVFVVGDFNNWQFDLDYLMNVSPDGNTYWLQINGLTPGQEYRFHYHVMPDNMRIADPYTEKVLDYWNDPEILPIANHFGGDLAGIKDRVNDGYFEKLGVNAVWISPIARNADGAWGLWDKGVRSKFSGYHGYWPVRSKEIDPHFGDSATFNALIGAMHAKNMNILVDYVANHVHQDHPVIQQHPDWATPLFLPDGRMNTELWDEHRLTTWFDTFLPTLDFERQEVTDAMTDSALYWIKSFEIDGFRHDATKHIPDQFWRTLTLKIKRELAAQGNDRQLFQIGETYGNPELIGSYISSGLLNAQFDFNLYDAAVDAFAKPESNFDNLIRVLKQSLKYYGSHHRMGNISGNQDRARFISYADGSVQFDEDPKLAGWTRTIENQGSIGFERLALLHAFNLTVPGIPCLYYGDEIGMPGANDPDNRRQMTFSGWNAAQQELFDLCSALSRTRRQRMSLMYGDLTVVYADASLLVYDRSYLGETTRVALAKAACSYLLEQAYKPLVTHRATVTQAALTTQGPGIAIWAMDRK